METKKKEQEKNKIETCRKIRELAKRKEKNKHEGREEKARQRVEPKACLVETWRKIRELEERKEGNKNANSGVSV